MLHGSRYIEFKTIVWYSISTIVFRIIIGEFEMRGKIQKLFKDSGFIKCPKKNSGHYFKKDTLIGINFDELVEGDSVEFSEVMLGDKPKAKFVRKATYEYLAGVITEVGNVKHWNNETSWKIKSNQGRMFWFVEKCICPGEVASEFQVGDSVRFRCDGYYAESNEATLVTKKTLGYVTSCDFERGNAFVDFKYKLELDARLRRTLSEEDKYFYLISYEIDEDFMTARNVVVIDKTTEILFDQAEKWIDAVVERKGLAKDGRDFFILSPDASEQVTFKIDETCMRNYCDCRFLKVGDRVAFKLDDNSKPFDVSWVGYITRFPVNPVVKDGSGRINTFIAKGEKEEKNPELLYFQKFKISNLQGNEEMTRFWLDAMIFGDVKRIFIKTVNTNLRYKVVFAKKEDEVYDEKAFSIRMIGISKAPVAEEDIEILENGVAPIQYIVNNNYHGTVNQQINVLNVNGIDNFLKVANTENFGQYIDTIHSQWLLECKEKNEDGRIVENFGEKLIDKIVPKEQDIISDETYQTLDDKFEEARYIRKDLTDSLLNKMGDTCKLYVKIAVIVEYSLLHLAKIPTLDFSAQLVMYGKALEQALRDYFYDWIISDKELANIIDYSGKSFCLTPKNQTTIGQYTKLLFSARERFAQTCYENQKGMSEKSLEEWKMWWRILQSNINTAREMRNISDHAGVAVTEDTVHEMGNILFSADGIFESLQSAYMIYTFSKK